MAERPDDSRLFDDDTLIAIIAERFERLSDPITRRDGLWLVEKLAGTREALRIAIDSAIAERRRQHAERTA